MVVVGRRSIALIQCGLKPASMPHQLDSEFSAAASFGTLLRSLRARAGLSQEALAERAGLGVATLKALEHDQRQRPHPNTLAQLADALGLTPEDREAFLDSRQAAERQSRPAAIPDLIPESPPGEPELGMAGWLRGDLH
jgi:transcriptional regulator with XRE-family HTH domain